TGTENLLLIGALLDLRRAEAKARAAELLARFELTEAADRPARTYSGGVRRRLDLAATLGGNRLVVVLADATSSLETAKRRAARGPRRAHHRPGPGQARRRLGHDPLAGRRRVHGAAHHPVPGGGRRARRRDLGHRPRAGDRPRHPGRAETDRGPPDHRGPPRP